MTNYSSTHTHAHTHTIDVFKAVSGSCPTPLSWTNGIIRTVVYYQTNIFGLLQNKVPTSKRMLGIYIVARATS